MQPDTADILFVVLVRDGIIFFDRPTITPVYLYTCIVCERDRSSNYISLAALL